MDDRTKERLAALRAEAASLFAANQAGRAAAERVLTLAAAVVAVAVAAGVNANTDDVLIPLPAVVLLLLTYMFHQYADVTVLGRARQELEIRTNALLGENALVYETAVADVRKQPPLSLSVRMLQSLCSLVVVGLLVAGTIVAFDDQRWYVTVAYLVVTLGALVTAVVAWWGMHRSDAIAAATLAGRIGERRTPPDA